jgi:exosortase/archaeosortase family protein
MRIRLNWVFKRYIFFAIMLLLIIPTIFSLFIVQGDFMMKLRTVYQLQKIYIIFSILVLVLFILTKKKLDSYKPRKRSWKEPLIFGIIAATLFVLAFNSQIDFEKIIMNGVGYTDRVNLDQNRLLSTEIFNDIDYSQGMPAVLNTNFDSASRTVKAENALPEVIWYTSWIDANKDETLDRCKITLTVNKDTYDATAQYTDLAQREVGFLHQPINQSSISTIKNTIILRKNCPDQIILYSQKVYSNHGSSSIINGARNPTDYDEYLMTFKTSQSPAEWIIFKLGILLRIAAIIALFIAFYGLGILRYLFVKAKIELAFSFIYSLFMYWFSIFVQGYWYILSAIVIYFNYFLLYITGLHPTMGFDNPSMPMLGAGSFVSYIAQPCSGIESIGYFILAYFIMVVANWKEIDFKKAMIMIIPGLLGTVLQNTLRIYILFLISIFVSVEIGMGLYHTNAGMIMFIIYFVPFWLLSMKWMRKKSGKGRRQSKEKR